MFSLVSNWAVVVFCSTITLFALTVATGIEFIFYPEEFATTAPGKKAIIVFAISVPATWWVALIIRKNQLLTKELQALVNRDRLTDVATRDYFFARITDFPEAYGVSLMVDIDHFKQVNDTHGHLAGDKVIQTVAQVMRAQIRDQDIVCRFGGEEFVVFLHKATPQDGWVIAERIRANVGSAATPTLQGNVNVTVSVGGSLKERMEHIDDAIRRADECLYRAKAAGRNRTIVDWRRDPETLAVAS